VVARGAGWTVADVICTCGPDDRPYEEQHARFAIALVVAGMFEHRGTASRSLLTSGSVMLGAPGASFECRHEHSRGDRAVAFWYDPAYLEAIATDVGTGRNLARIGASDLPPRREWLPLVVRAAARMVGHAANAEADWNELAVVAAASALRMTGSQSRAVRGDAHATRRIAEIVRHIDTQLSDDTAAQPADCADLSLDALAARAGLSAFHFLRSFTAVLGETPHRFVRRARLRRAGMRLLSAPDTILDIALHAGFNDLSTFNRAFKAEFGVPPRRFRQQEHACP
jgi:AraC-like DNA-binding protein